MDSNTKGEDGVDGFIDLRGHLQRGQSSMPGIQGRLVERQNEMYENGLGRQSGMSYIQRLLGGTDLIQHYRPGLHEKASEGSPRRLPRPTSMGHLDRRVPTQSLPIPETVTVEYDMVFKKDVWDRIQVVKTFKILNN